MIRTAILAGIFLVLLSMAYSRPGAVPENMRSVAAMIEEQPAVKAPVRKQAARIPAPKADEPVALPVQAKAEAPPAEIARKEEPMPPPAPVAQDVPRPPAQPTLLLPPAHDEVAVAAPAASTLRNPIPLVPPADTSAPAKQAAASPAPLPSVDEMPLINVPARPVMTPWDAPPRPKTTPPAAPAPAETAAKQPDDAAPKLMTPQERSRELYRLAREMEDTFIQKLGR